jgi:Mrp family chromosome partitioning ATPase
MDHRHAFENVVEGLLKWKLHGRSVIGIAGCYAGQGCTTLTLCLAKVLADMGKPTAIVEANFSAPSLAEQLDVYPDASWQDVLWRGVPVGEALMISVTEPVAMLPLNPNDIREPNGEIASEAFTTSRVLQNNYDFVLVDLGPMLAPENQSIALEMVAGLAAQGALIVSDSSMSMPGDPEVVGRLLTQVGCDPIGIVETFAERHAA